MDNFKEIYFIEYPNVPGCFAKIEYQFKNGKHIFKPADIPKNAATIGYNLGNCYDKNGNLLSYNPVRNCKDENIGVLSFIE